MDFDRECVLCSYKSGFWHPSMKLPYPRFATPGGMPPCYPWGYRVATPGGKRLLPPRVRSLYPWGYGACTPRGKNRITPRGSHHHTLRTFGKSLHYRSPRSHPLMQKSLLGEILQSFMLLKKSFFFEYCAFDLKTPLLFASFSVGSAKMPCSDSMTASRSYKKKRGRVSVDRGGFAALHSKWSFIIAIIDKNHFAQLSGIDAACLMMRRTKSPCRCIGSTCEYEIMVQ